MPATGADIALASARTYTRRYLTRATWRETYADGYGEPVILRQTPLIAVTKVTADGTVLAEDTDYHVDWTRARLMFQPAWWGCCDATKLVIEYEAGFDPLPADLQAAIDAAGAAIDAGIAAGGGVAGIASVDMPDVGAVRFIDTTAGGSGDGLLPALAPFAGTLSGYRDNTLLWKSERMRRIEMVPP